MIDLDLVELRCRLRGWECQRRAGGIPEVRIAAPEGGVWLAQDGSFGGVSVYGRDGDGVLFRRACAAHDSDVRVRVDALTAPRWTLDRLLADPPEGWRVVERPDERGWSVWSWTRTQMGHEVEVHWARDGWARITVGDAHRDGTRHHDMAALAERLRAAAELALILAEVEA